MDRMWGSPWGRYYLSPADEVKVIGVGDVGTEGKMQGN